MNKETIAFGITLIFLALVIIIRTIYLVKENLKLKKSPSISTQTLFDLSNFVVNSADLMNKANRKIIDFELDHSDLDLSLLHNAFELNTKAIESIYDAANILIDTIDEYQNGKKTEVKK